MFMLAVLLATSAVAHAAPPPKARVMIVGVAHLVAKRDFHNSVFTDSPLSPKRQAEIADVVARLAAFHPTKVLIEAPMGDATYPNQYRAYRAGRFTLPANEAYQFGFRLAARAGDSSIYPIDTWGPPIYDDASADGKRIDAYLSTNFKNIDDPLFDAYVAHDDAIEKSGTYLDVLRYINTDAAIRANASSYSVLAGMGRSSASAGATYVSQWYTRNTFIFSNMLSVIRPGDRVVVFMGQGHEYLLREFVRLNPHLVDVDPLAYLK